MGKIPSTTIPIILSFVFLVAFIVLALMQLFLPNIYGIKVDRKLLSHQDEFLYRFSRGKGLFMECLDNDVDRILVKDKTVFSGAFPTCVVYSSPEESSKNYDFEIYVYMLKQLAFGFYLVGLCLGVCVLIMMALPFVIRKCQGLHESNILRSWMILFSCIMFIASMFFIVGLLVFIYEHYIEVIYDDSNSKYKLINLSTEERSATNYTIRWGTYVIWIAAFFALVSSFFFMFTAILCKEVFDERDTQNEPSEVYWVRSQGKSYRFSTGPANQDGEYF